MNFLKNVLASMVGTFVAMGLVMLVFFLIIIAAIGGAAEGKKEVSLKDNSILHITLDDAVAERGQDSQFDFSGGTFKSSSKVGLNDFIADLHHAQTDDHIKGIFLELEAVMAAPSSMLDLRKALLDFRNSGKWIVAYSENYTQGAYYLASAANEVYMYPTGNFDWRGLSTEVMFFKKMMDKLGIEAQIIRGPNNKFKSAVEPFLYDKMSPENKAQIETFVGDIWRIMLDQIGEQRGITVEALNQYADSLSISLPEKAVAVHMVDGLKYRDEVMALMKGKLGMDLSTPDKDMHFLDLADYKSAKGHDDDMPDFKKDKVAVVYAVGAIESGEGDDQTIGSERIAAALKKAREDEKVKAIVLRVNSPGGSALASDVIWRETQLIKQSGKPFVVSMGDYAASGGYYISCAADKIYANPNTITGSIGVFGIVPNMQKFLDEKVGITFDRFQTNPHAGMMSITKPLDPAEMKAMQGMVTDIYDDFTSKVAEGRKMSQARVDSIGQGRVWSGEDAKNLGLVDELGNLDAAVTAAAQMANISDYGVKELPTMIDPFEKFMRELTGEKEAQVMQQMLGANYKYYESAKRATEMNGIQTRLPFMLDIQ